MGEGLEHTSHCLCCFVPAAIDCDVLDGIDNGYVTYTGGTLLNSMAEYFCNTGYLLPPWASTRTCLDTGHWSGTEPACSRKLLLYVHTQ